MHPSLKFLTVARKAGVALLGVAGAGLAMGYIPAPWDALVTGILSVAAYYGVYAMPNKSNNPEGGES